MQMFSFIFLNRSWASDKGDLTNQLNQLADQTYRPKIESINKIGLLIFPEGTLVSPLTRPLSKKYADKRGLSDLRHCLLPRSTGSLFCMRALSRKIPNLKLIDLTIGYPGVPPNGYGQDYYTLQSIFGHGHPPPKVHIHIKIIPISEIPIGDLHGSTLNPTRSSHRPSSLVSLDDQEQVVDRKKVKVGHDDRLASSSDSPNQDPSPEEFEKFDRWLRDLWTEKDSNLDYFYRHGHFPNHQDHPEEEGDDRGNSGPIDPSLSEYPDDHHLDPQNPRRSPSRGRREGQKFESQIRVKHPWDILRTLGLTLPGLMLVILVGSQVFRW